MPIELKITPAAHDPALPLFTELPAFVVLRPVGPDDWAEAHGRTPDGCTHHFYYCPYCSGWLDGIPSAHPLPGGRGTEFCCIRCGKRMGFALRLA